MRRDSLFLLSKIMKQISYRRLLTVLFTFIGVQIVGALVTLLVGGISMGVLLLAVNAVALMLGIALRFTTKRDWSRGQTTIGESLLLLLAIVLLCAGLNMLAEPLDLPDLTAEMMLQVLGNPLGAIAVAIVGPLCEEVFFRAGIMGHACLRVGTSVRTAIITSALLFGLIHGNPAQTPFAFCVGLALGYAYYRTRSLLVPALAHIVNSGTVALSYYILGDEAFSSFRLSDLMGGTWQVVLLGSALTLVGLCLLWRMHKRSPSLTPEIY